MNFYQSTKKSSPQPPSGAEYPCIVFVKIDWDDFNYKTQFRLFFFEDPACDPTRWGDTKILHQGNPVTKVPAHFTELDETYVSLGQNLDFYENARRNIGAKLGRAALEAINDVVLTPKLQDAVETTTGFRNSLVRYNEAKMALRYGLGSFQGTARSKKYEYAFKYDARIPGADVPVTVSFPLDSKDPIPGRLVAIIGRNGVGKTQFLARLAIDLATPVRLSRASARQIEDAFRPQRPLFSRVIALSFSAFDKFIRPQKKNISYIYCGVLDDGGKLSRTALEARHIEFLKRIQELDREDMWEKQIALISNVSKREVSIGRYIKSIDDGSIPAMSSGQSILIYFVSAALAYMKEDSLILFDEPEIHLHPAAVSMLMRILHFLLEEYDSYAIVATHSPVVIQEVPGSRVVRFERSEYVTSAYPLEQESFGENLSELTKMVFETVETPSFYKQTFRELIDEFTVGEIAEMFDGQLSLHASAYLASLAGRGDA
ncbi:ATP-binding protein [Pseudomonas sp. B6002]|uniref:ATP-dependent nuclease n=1 Tax=Pseudomonas sp. B6002 TaxID=2726978 RepID=UPI0015A0F791|nr:ATP-binding protein [Pseudomonas sp. B6002]